MTTEWVITKEHIMEPSAVGKMGPKSGRMNAVEIASHPGAVKFRMKDDDNEIYYEGLMVGDNYFAPLDDYGTPNAGCTSIEIFENGHWETV